MVDSVSYLDSAGSLERIFNRDYSSSKFVMACYLDDDNGNLSSYISGEMNAMELTFLISELERRKREIFEDFYDG